MAGPEEGASSRSGSSADPAAEDRLDLARVPGSGASLDSAPGADPDSRSGAGAAVVPNSKTGAGAVLNLDSGTDSAAPLADGLNAAANIRTNTDANSGTHSADLPEGDRPGGHAVTKILGATPAEVERQLTRLAAHYSVHRAADGAFLFGVGVGVGVEAGQRAEAESFDASADFRSEPSSDSASELDSPIARLTLKPGPARKIALLEIPTTQVELTAMTADTQRFTGFLRDLERVTQRGGG